MNPEYKNRGFAAVGLYVPKNNINVGAVLRAAQCYRAALVVIQGRKRVRYPTDTCKAWRHHPVIFTDNLLDSIPYDAVPVAIECVESAKSLVNYTHPERAFYVFGPEDGTLPKDILSRCRDVIQIPTNGCMNLAATANVVLYDRLLKMINPRPSGRLRGDRKGERR